MAHNSEQKSNKKAPVDYRNWFEVIFPGKLDFPVFPVNVLESAINLDKRTLEDNL